MYLWVINMIADDTIDQTLTRISHDPDNILRSQMSI